MANKPTNDSSSTVSSSSSTTLRPIHLLFRSKEAVELYALPDTSISSKSSPPHSSSPPTKGGRILYQGKTTFHLLSPNGECAFVHDSSIGLIRCDLNPDGRDGSDVSGGNAFLKEDSKAVQLAKCSPRGSYLLTWERPSNSSSGASGGNNNLKVWSAKTGDLLQSFSCKKATLDVLQWTYDERLAFHLVTNEVHVYECGMEDGVNGMDCSNRADGVSGKDWKRAGKVRCPSISSFSLPSVRGYASNENIGSNNNSSYLLTVFIPGTKGKPSRIDLLRYPDRMGRESSTVSTSSSTGDTTTDGPTNANLPSGHALTSKSLFNAEEAHVHWSPRADSALILTQTSIDSTGESYYGSSHLFLLLENDSKRPGQGAALSVPLPPEATKDTKGAIPIIHSSWIPNPTIPGPVPFVVISGRMPALASLHHGITGEPSFLFGRGHRNTVDVAPHGRFLVVGGYGNLAGGMDFWDRNKGKLIPRHVILPGGSLASASNEGGGGGEMSYVTIKDPACLAVTSSSPVVGHQWAPDSRTYLVSTTSPRMNVENGVHIYRYDGTLIEEQSLPWDNSKYRPDKLLSAEYVPSPFPIESSVDSSAADSSTDMKKEFYYYPDRPQSPPPRKYNALTGDAAAAALAKLQQSRSNGNNAQGANTASAGVGGNGGGGAYVPPAARNAGGASGGGAYVPPGARKGGTSLAERMRQEREGSAANVSGKKVTKRVGPVGASSVASTSKNVDEKSKSAQRKEKQRLAKEQAEKEAAEANEREERRKKEEEAARSQANLVDPEKRAKKIKKTLKQIEEIKAKEADGEELNEDQKAKVANEESLKEELAALGLG